MSDEKNKTKDQLIDEQKNLAGNHPYLNMVASQGELISRLSSDIQSSLVDLKKSIDNLSEASEKISKKMLYFSGALFWATLVLALATVALVVATCSH